MHKANYQGDPICFLFDNDCGAIEVGASILIELHCTELRIVITNVVKKGYWMDSRSTTNDDLWVCSVLEYDIYKL